LKEALPLNESVLVFLHIKKTGGISLQKLIQEQYPDRFYGNDHSALKKKIKIKKSDIEKIPNGSAVANHWIYDDFKSIKDRCNFVTIIRDPVDRIVSAYNFYLQHHPRGMSFSDYVKKRENRNTETRAILEISLMTEFYLFEKLPNEIHRSNIILSQDKIQHTNKTRYNCKPTRSEIKVFRDINDEDIKLYDGAIKMAGVFNECI